MFYLFLIAIAAGYIFGKFTCSQHFSKHGFWLTLGLFVFLNTAHAVFDGMLLRTSDARTDIFLVALHEIIRQPALYFIALAMLAPWRQRFQKVFYFLICTLMVTGTWLVGMYIGSVFSFPFETDHEYVGLSYGFFAGDILHHVVDYFSHKKQHK